MLNFFLGKKVVITGGSSGIGKAFALSLAKSGAHVCIWARNAERLESSLAEIRSGAISAGQKIISMAVDVTDRAQVKASAGEAVKQLGGIDILLNSAGITWPARFMDIPDKIWDSMIQVDYMGTVNATRAFAPFLITQKSGNIVNISSTVGYMGVFGYAAYGPAKFAVTGFTECLRQEMLPYNVNVSVVFPPDTDTPQLHEENKIKPQETRVLSGNIKVMSASKVAAAILKGIKNRSFSIVPGAMNRFTYFMNRHFPSIVWMIVSGDLRKYWKKNQAVS
jgi:3-dehydrosphinganine reductase